MEQTLKQVQQGQLIHNIYCPTAEQTIATCELEMLTLHKQQNVYFEVPFEQFNDVYRHFRENDVLIKGAFTYMQVRHIARTGNIHQLNMSEEGRIDFAEESMSISVAIAFAQSKWNGATRKEAVANAVLTGLTVVGEVFAKEVIARQVKYISVEEGLKGRAQKHDANEASQKIALKVRSIIEKKASMFIDKDVVTGAIVTGIMTREKVARTIKAEMSKGQLAKRISKILLASNVLKQLLKGVVKEEAIEMLAVFNEELTVATNIFLLNEQELKQALNDFNVIYNLNEELRKMYTAPNRVAYAQMLIENELTRIVKLRMYLQIPLNEELYEVMNNMN